MLQDRGYSVIHVDWAHMDEWLWLQYCELLLEMGDEVFLFHYCQVVKLLQLRKFGVGWLKLWLKGLFFRSELVPVLDFESAGTSFVRIVLFLVYLELLVEAFADEGGFLEFRLKVGDFVLEFVVFVDQRRQFLRNVLSVVFVMVVLEKSVELLLRLEIMVLWSQLEEFLLFCQQLGWKLLVLIVPLGQLRLNVPNVVLQLLNLLEGPFVVRVESVCLLYQQHFLLGMSLVN